jgi:hypothetical protein
MRGSLLMAFRACTVTFRDDDGVLQTAKVDAETAFEAVLPVADAGLQGRWWSMPE